MSDTADNSNRRPLTAWEKEQERRAAQRRKRFIHSPLWQPSVQGWWRRWKGVRLLVARDAEDLFRAGVVKGGRWQWSSQAFETENDARSECLDLFDAAIVERAAEEARLLEQITEGDDEHEVEFTTEDLRGEDEWELSTEDIRIFSTPEFSTEEVRYAMDGTEEDFDFGTTEWPLSSLPPDFPDLDAD